MTTHGVYPRVCYGNGAWHFIDGNSLRARIFDPENNVFVENDSDYYFVTQSLTGPPENLYAVETVTAMAAGDFGVVFFSDASRAAHTSHFDESFQFSDESESPGSITPIRGAVYGPGDGRWVAVAGRIFSSDDGTSWTTRRGLSGDQWQGVAAGPEFVAVSDTGKAIRSLNGITWLSPTTIDAGIDFKDICYAEGYYVAVGGDKIYSSPHGVTWTAQYNYPGANFQGVAYGNGTWVAVPANGDRIHYAVNAEASGWSSHTNITPTSLSDVTFAQGLFVAIGSGGELRWSKGVTRGSDRQHTSSATTASIPLFSDSSFSPWQASTSNPWITLEDPVNGVGNGSLTYQLAQNTGIDREGCITVNGETVRVQQAGVMGEEQQAPTNLMAQFLVQGVMVTWTDAKSESSYSLERSLGGGAWTNVASLSANEQHYHDTIAGLLNGDLVQYRLRTHYLNGLSVTTTIPADNYHAASAPEVLAVSLSNSEVALAWTFTREGPYEIERNGVVIASPTSSEHSYLDSLPLDLRSGAEEIAYIVRWTSTPLFGQPFLADLPPVVMTSKPAPITGGVATPLDAQTNELRWMAPVTSSSSPARFRYVVSSVNANGFTEYIETVDAPSFSHRFSGESPASYEVTTLLAADEESRSIGAQVCLRDVSGVADHSASLTDDDAVLNFSSRDLNAENWEIQRKVNGGSWVTLARPEFDSVAETYSIPNSLVYGNDYNFQVRIQWRGRYSEWLETGEQRADLAAVSSLLVAENNPGQLFINWPNLNGAEDYELQRSLNGISGWATIVTPASSQYTDTGVTTGTSYHYRVRGRHATDSDAPWSIVVSGIPPAALVLLENYHDKRSFLFVPPAKFDDLVLERSTSASFTSKVDIATLSSGRPPDPAWYGSDGEVFFPGTVYRYRVRIEDGRNVSYSEIRSVYPVAFPPTDLMASEQEAPRRIALSWVPSLSGSTYDIERMTVGNGGGFETLAVDWASSAYGDTTAMPGVKYRYRVLSKAAFPFWGPSRYSNEVEAFLENSLVDWRYTHFGFGQNIGDAANDADPDDDGLGNLAELMLDLDPNENDVFSPLMIWSEPQSMVHVQYTLREDYETWPVEVELESSDNLTSWPFMVTPTEPMIGTDATFQHSQAAGGVPLFFRLIFTESTP